jgi:Mg-chelatase subunit ChlI
MNPEEGALRPQLLDRFGLSVAIDDNPNLQQRLAIVAARLAFDHDPVQFYPQYAAQQRAIKQQLAAAQQHLTTVTVSTESKIAIAQHCINANVEGVRADLALYRAARAQTAMRLGHYVSKEDIDAVAELVLQHRRQQQEQQPPHSSSITPKPQQHNETSNETTPKPRTQHEKTGDESTAQGDWGEMPVEAVAIGLKRQLDPNKFSQHRTAQQKKKR